MFDTFQEIFATLRRSKLRTALTGISVSVGIFLLIVLLGAGNGIINAFLDMRGALALDVMNIFSGITSKPYNGMKEGRRVQIDTRDMQIASTNFPGTVLKSSAQVTQSNITVRYGKQHIVRTFNGVSPAYREMNTATDNMRAGRFVNDVDMRQRRKVIVISENDADYLFGTYRNAVGKYVTADGGMYRVVGVCSYHRGNNDMYVPYTTLKSIYNKGNNLDKIMLRTRGIKSHEDVDRFDERYRAIASRVHMYAPDDAEAVWMFNTSAGAEEMNKAFDILRVTLWVIGILTLLSGVVSISNIMLITVRERTHEFGIRKALGARPMTILRGVIVESVVITTFFGYAGMVLGVLATEYLNYVGGKYTVTVDNITMTLFSNPTVDILTCVEALVVMITAGVVAGLIPARKAVKVKPIEALRAE